MRVRALCSTLDHMTRTGAFAAALTAGAIATAIAVMPAQGYHPYGHDPATTQMMSFTATQGPRDEHFIDLSPRGPSAGDRVALVSTLRRDGKVAGRLSGDCAWTNVKFEILQCEVVLVLPDGRVTLQGAYANERIPYVGGTREVYAVTGGSGAYEGATGTMSRTSGRGGDTLELALGG
jgi:hypothetical protein